MMVCDREAFSGLLVDRLAQKLRAAFREIPEEVLFESSVEELEKSLIATCRDAAAELAEDVNRGFSPETNVMHSLLSSGNPSRSAAWALHWGNNIETFADLLALTESEVLALPEIGEIKLAKIKALLRFYGARLKPECVEERCG
jgi:DNA-directed RNA polymerase alpha subunit